MGANLKERVSRDFQALHDFLLREEAARLEQLRRDQIELEHGLERHLEALYKAVGELEQAMGSLQIANSAVGKVALVEVKDSYQLLTCV